MTTTTTPSEHPDPARDRLARAERRAARVGRVAEMALAALRMPSGSPAEAAAQAAAMARTDRAVAALTRAAAERPL